MPPDALGDCLLGLLRPQKHKSPARDGPVRNHSIAAGIRAVSGSILASGAFWHIPPLLSPQESRWASISATYRTVSDSAQAYLPVAQAVVDAVPVVGGVVKAAIVGLLSVLQLVDRYVQNKDDLETLKSRLRLLHTFIDNAPIVRPTFEGSLRQWLLGELQTAQINLERMEERIRAAPSLTQDIARCITAINEVLLQYMALSQMQLQSDVFDIKTVITELRQMQSNGHSVAVVQIPATISRGFATLVDATGREHDLLLDQCLYLDQLDLMLRASIYKCRPDEREILEWYIQRKRYDFALYSGSNVMQLTRNSNLSDLRPGTKVFMRAIDEVPVVDPILTVTYTCPCGTTNTMTVSTQCLGAALRRGCTIVCRHCERRVEIKRDIQTQRGTDRAVDLGAVPKKESKVLIRNVVVKEIVTSVRPRSRPPLKGSGKQRVPQPPQRLPTPGRSTPASTMWQSNVPAHTLQPVELGMRASVFNHNGGPAPGWSGLRALMGWYNDDYITP